MADNAFVKIGAALLKHQIKKLVGEETLGVLSEELADIGGDKLDAWLADKSTLSELEKAAETTCDCFHGKIGDAELEQYIYDLPLHNLPNVLEALKELPTSPDETQLENALRESIALNWKRLSPEQVNHAVDTFLSCLRSALLPIEKQTLMVIGRTVLRIEDKVDQLAKLVVQLKPYSPTAPSKSRFVAEINVGRDVLNSVAVAGNHNVINYYAAVEKNVEKHEPDYWALKHPYPMPPNFTGRVAERAVLTHWLNDDAENRLFILRALGGFGKSALAWHWLTHDVDSQDYPKVLWWSFYEGDASFEHFAEETLKYLNHAVPQSKREQVDELLKVMQAQKVLLVMDGFERALRAYSSMSAAYQADESPLQSTPGGLPEGEGQGEGENTQLDCVDLNAELFLKSVCALPNLKGKVLMTTRLTPRAVKPRGEIILGCREAELTAMDKTDAVTFFQRQKIKGTHAEVEAACEPYGYHPLSLRLLAGRIVKDFDNPGDIVVAQHLKIDGDIIQQKHHVLEVSYNSLPTPEQKLLSMIACFRAPVELKMLEAVANDVGAEHDSPRSGAERDAPPLRDQLHDLVDRGLLHFDDKNKKFDLHPIVRRFAYDCLTAADRTGAHERLVNYFQAVPKPQNVKTLEDLAPVIELYHHTVRAGDLDEACYLLFERLVPNPLHYQFGAYQLMIELERALFPDGEDKPPRLKKEGDQAWTLNALAISYSLSGQSHRAIPLLEMQIAIREKQGVNKSVAIGLGNVANDQLKIGTLGTAERNLRRRIDLCREIADEGEEAVGHQGLGRLLSYRGAWQEAEQELSIAEKAFDKNGANQTNYVSLVRSYRTLRFLLMAREETIFDTQKSNIGYRTSAIQCAKRALELADEFSRAKFKLERDYIRIYWLLGSAYRMNNELTLAEENLSKALNLCRQINLVEMEADILLDIARLSYASQNSTGTTQGDFKDAQEKASEALMITERSGYVLQGADVNNFLAELALEQEKDKTKAKQYAETALKLAHCDDGPPYYYKVAYEEAERMIEKLK